MARMTRGEQQAVRFVLHSAKTCLTTCFQDVKNGQIDAALEAADALVDNAGEARRALREMQRQRCKGAA